MGDVLYGLGLIDGNTYQGISTGATQARKDADFAGMLGLGLAGAVKVAAWVAKANTTLDLGKASFSAHNQMGQIYSPKVLISGQTITYTDFSVGTARGFIGAGEEGMSELYGPLRQLVSYSQEKGAKEIKLLGTFVTDEGAALGGGKVGDAFSYTFKASNDGLKDLIKQLRKAQN